MGAETGGAIAVFSETVPPGGGPPRHVHRDQIEVFHVIEGEIRFELDGETVVRGSGASVLVPAGAVHAFRNDGETPATIHFELLPAGRSEEFFSRLVAGEKGDPGAFFDAFGIDLCGPPLA